MNEPERSELERLKQRQELLGQELSFLGKQLQVLESRLGGPGIGVSESRGVRASERRPGA